MKFKKFLPIILFIIVFVVIIIFLWPRGYVKQVILRSKIFTVETVDTQALLEKGLSGRSLLAPDEGMLFVFQKPDKYGFWMKDMNFPIDIIWISPDFRIVSIEKSVSPSTYPTIFSSKEASLYVLEISAGEADKIGAKIGDMVTFVKKH